LAVALGGELACILLVDRLGRRWPLILGNVASGVTYMVSTAIYKTYPASVPNMPAHRAFVYMTWVYNFAFSSCIGPLSWAYPVEVLPTHLRAAGTSLTSMSAWISNFMIAQVTPKAFAAIGWRYYLVFCILSITNAVTFWAILPETKGRRLEEMEQLWRTSAWFVPAHPPRVLDAKQTEEDMAEGKIRAGVMTEDKVANSAEGRDEEKGDAPEHFE